ncbi:reverse transcriptase domain-containing protein [Roseimicrobium gellanilyticum]|uniref:reverse transcriptase domain-containing protein n=1 Tax=Roseimicrobium gellanilyticum TaxID=748857 RepID=UPI001FEC9844|nr:reverse transcriptase domain-containing protein [Roseimicrobium gellanilyticum]
MLRKWIPKPGKSEQRPLSLPTVKDRCRSRLVALVLEPEVEARLHRDVYGFRPGRSQHDAIASIRNFTNKARNGKFVLDADIENFFGSVPRDFLMRSLKLPRPLLRFIRSMLHAPTMDSGRLMRTTGIPQGSPLSPVLANLVLSGMHEHVEQHFLKLRHTDQTTRWKVPAIIVYADDLVALHTSEEALAHTRDALNDFLRIRGLRLHPTKTQVRHTVERSFGNVGFDFLGFTIRSFPVGKHKKTASQSGMQTLIQPSRKSLLRHHAQLATILRYHRHSPTRDVIAALNRNIRAWSAYYKTENVSNAFSREDHTLFQMLWAFIKRRHQKKTPAKELYALYWPSVNGRKRFRDPNGGEPLLSHADFLVEPHIKVRGSLSFYNGDRIYWATRRKRIHALARARRKLRDHGEDEVDTHHAAGVSETQTAEDLWLLHRARALAERVTGEPDAVKAARPVLKERSDPATG